jgi:hypothetical protein
MTPRLPAAVTKRFGRSASIPNWLRCFARPVAPKRERRLDDRTLAVRPCHQPSEAPFSICCSTRFVTVVSGQNRLPSVLGVGAETQAGQARDRCHVYRQDSQDQLTPRCQERHAPEKRRTGPTLPGRCD